MVKKQPVTVFVCSSCDRDLARWDTEQAEGLAHLGAVRKLFKNKVGVKVCGVSCLGGCEALPAQTDRPNGCCSVGFAGPGRHSYVFNRLDPAHDGWKLREFLKMYLLRPNGRIRCREHERGAELKPHIATKVPPFKVG